MVNDLFDEMRRMHQEMNRLFSNFWSNEWKMLPSEKKEIKLFREPLYDLKDRGKELAASIELPGVNKRDIKINITDNSLEVKVEKKAESKVEKKGYLREERSYKGFYRMMSLPVDVKADKAKASYKDGVLEVVMPKAESRSRKTGRKIKVD